MDKIERLQAQVRAAQGRLSLQRQVLRSNVTRDPTYKAGCTLIDVSDFNQVLEVTDTHVILEPLVTMEEMVAATLPHDRIPQVVPEFRGITVGGAVMGAALESSSHQFGQFSNIIEWCDVVLGNGDLIRLSPNENSDLFDALSGSYGTLAILVRVCLRLMPAKPFVQVCTHHTSTLEWEPGLFNDGLARGPGDYLLMSGEMADRPQGPLLKQRPWSRWFYQQVQEGTSTLSLQDYLFRFDRGAFWMGRFILNPSLFWSYLRKSAVPPDKLARLMPRLKDKDPNALFRILFGRLTTTQKLYKGLHSMPAEFVKRLFLIQDSVIPREHTETFIEYVSERHAPWPLWLCPVRRTERPQWLSMGPFQSAHPVPINVGTYGVSLMGDAREATRHLEQKVHELGGVKGLYSHSYYTPDEFWNLYDRGRYDQLREKYHAEGRFPSLEEKVLCG